MKDQYTILCYGDSNTWGYIPLIDHSKSIQRYPREIRWPGALQNLLGEKYHVIEEGLNSRTTNIDYQIPPDRNGKTYLPSCLYSHAPIDLVVLALGGNDFKIYFNREPEAIRDGLKDLIEIIQQSQYGEKFLAAPKVLIIPPPIPLSIVKNYKDENGVIIFQNEIEKAEKLIALYSELAIEKQCHFLDTSKIIPSEIDGVHFDLEGHKKMGILVHNKIKQILC